MPAGNCCALELPKISQDIANQDCEHTGEADIFKSPIVVLPIGNGLPVEAKFRILKRPEWVIESH